MKLKKGKRQNRPHGQEEREQALRMNPADFDRIMGAALHVQPKRSSGKDAKRSRP